MRLVDRLISFIFSLIFLVLSIVLILIGTGVIDPQMCIDLVQKNLLNEEIVKQGMFNPITITGIVLLLLSLKTTIFVSFLKEKSKAPITVKTNNGEVQIAQETIINTAKNQTLEYENVKEAQASMEKKARGVIIYEIIQVYTNTNIRELTEAIQSSVKSIVYATTGVNVLDVNIKIKNVYNGKRKEEPENKEIVIEPNVKVEEVVAPKKEEPKKEEVKKEDSKKEEEKPQENKVEEKKEENK